MFQDGNFLIYILFGLGTQLLLFAFNRWIPFGYEYEQLWLKTSLAQYRMCRLLGILNVPQYGFWFNFNSAVGSVKACNSNILTPNSPLRNPTALPPRYLTFSQTNLFTLQLPIELLLLLRLATEVIVLIITIRKWCHYNK